MLSSISNVLRNIFSKNSILFLFILLFIYLNYIVGKVLEKLNGVSLLDVKIDGYSSKEAYEILETLGDNGRSNYLILYTHQIDNLFSFLLTGIQISLISKCYTNLKSKTSLFNLVPIFFWVCDLFENYYHEKILIEYPSKTINNYIPISSNLCSIKYKFLFASTGILVIGLLYKIFYFIYSLINKKIKKNK